MSYNARPMVQRRRLRLELRQARQDAGLTLETVAERMDWSPSKIIRIETGSVGISTNDLKALLELYEVKDDQRVSDLVARAREAKQHTWWTSRRDVLPPGYFQYIEHEISASIIRSYEALAVPSLLQTNEYLTAIVRLDGANFTAIGAAALIEAEMTRQEFLLNQSEAPQLFFVLDEAVIHRLIGDRDLRQAQLEKLINTADMHGITIQIVPFAAGLHRATMGNFTILEFSEPTDNGVISYNSIRGSPFSRDMTDEVIEVAKYRELFEDLREKSLDAKESLHYLREIAQDTAQTKP